MEEYKWRLIHSMSRDGQAKKKKNGATYHFVVVLLPLGFVVTVIRKRSSFKII
jgi:hypothetical protein